MLDQLIAEYHLHPIVDHFTIALLTAGSAVEFLAAALRLFRRSNGRFSRWRHKLRNTSLLLMVSGAGAAVLSRFTGDSEADRLWDSMSPAAQHLLLSGDGVGQYLSHAVLGQYLMYAFLILGAWRALIEVSARAARWRVAFLLACAMAVSLLLYQGKTGGELVYEHGIGITGSPSHPATNRRHRENPKLRSARAPRPDNRFATS
jgi:uncharacterized membrane protein